MRGIVFITLVLCFLVSCISESQALKVHKLNEVEEVIPDVEETEKPTEQKKEEKEVDKPSEGKEVAPKKISVKTIIQETLQKFGEETLDVEETEKPTEQKKEPEKEIKKLPTAVEAKRALIEKKRRQIDNTSWEIELIPLGSKAKGKKQIDILTFKNNQVASANLFQSGFSSTNYTLTVQEDGGVVWETMQTSKEGRIAFWRGEIDPNMAKMQGILSQHISDKITQDYSFSSTAKKAITPSD